MSESLLSKHKIYFEDLEDYPEITKAVRRLRARRKREEAKRNDQKALVA